MNAQHSGLRLGFGIKGEPVTPLWEFGFGPATEEEIINARGLAFLYDRAVEGSVSKVE
jgi:hypothetical protein